MSALECLDAAELFSTLSPQQRRVVAAAATIRSASAGTRLFELGTEARELYVLCRGQIELTFPLVVKGSAREIRFQLVEAGGTIAWSALVPPHRLTMSAAAVAESTLCAFRREALLDIFVSTPSIGLAVICKLSEVIAARLVEFQALWAREMQRNVSQTYR